MRKLVLIIILVVASGLLVTDTLVRINQIKYYKSEVSCIDSTVIMPEYPYYLMEEVNDTVLYKTLKHYQFPYPEIITAQAVLETGNFKSRLCWECNNIFGLYNSSKHEYYAFDSWISCILKYKEFILHKHDDRRSYLKFLQDIGYAEDPDYIDKLKKISEKYKNLL